MRLTTPRTFRLVCIVVLMLSACGVAHGAAASPSVSRIDPNTAPTAGGVKLTISGSGFDTSDEQPAEVLIGGSPCSDVVVHSSTRITAIAPRSKTAGAVDLVIRHSGRREVRMKAALCYDDGSSWLARWYRIKARASSSWLLMEQGGAIMLLLTLLSIVGVAWAVHCGLLIRPSQVMPKPFLDKLSGHISRSELREGVDACQSEGSVFGRIAAAALRKAGEPPHKIREVAQAAGSREASHLFQKISYLSNLGVISPMLGLLGTVLGMILAFKAIGMGSEVGRDIVLAEAIYKAMITTAAGLVVGIPAMACYYYFRGKLLRIVTDMEQVVEEVAEAISAAGDEE
jgi:biopolymer transport protein ExbB